jgi:queuine tRNA-ribosyltransferase
MSFSFTIHKCSTEAPLARVGTIHTPHGDIQTPAFVVVGTKATVKALSPEMVRDTIKAQVTLANTYHLYLQPGESVVEQHGGFAAMMNWKNQKGDLLPTYTDSGGFQVFSLGQAMGHGVSKIATSEEISRKETQGETSTHAKLAVIDDEGVTFKSVIDGSEHRFTPESSMAIQHALGADMIFAFDECTSPLAPREYQEKALARTHAWAVRCIDEHKRLGASEATGCMQALFGVVQGGSFEDLRKISAETLGAMDFDGYGIGGSFTKEDMAGAVCTVTENLPEGKPRHLLGIGEPIDLFLGVEFGIDTFDCVAPTRVARNGALYTAEGRVNITNAKYANDMSPISDEPSFYTHNYTKSYLHHLFKSDEMFASTLASIHNLSFIVKLVDDMRIAILEDRFLDFKKEFCKRYYKEV